MKRLLVDRQFVDLMFIWYLYFSMKRIRTIDNWFKPIVGSSSNDGGVTQDGIGATQVENSADNPNSTDANDDMGKNSIYPMVDRLLRLVITLPSVNCNY